MEATGYFGSFVFFYCPLLSSGKVPNFLAGFRPRSEQKEQNMGNVGTTVGLDCLSPCQAPGSDSSSF